MSRNYKYTIEIRFSSTTNNQIGNFNVEYPYANNSSLKDKIVIKEKLIKITAYRSKKNSIADIIHNVNTAMNHQISKSLAFYYASVGEANNITSIKITRHLSGKIQESETIFKSNVRQIATSDNGFNYLKKIHGIELETIFEESDKGRSLLYAITHLISSCSSPEPFQQFEALWKCFNSIYKLKENATKDSDCLQSLRVHMLANVSKYPLSTTYVNSMTHDDIFSIVNWRNMILNDFKTESQSGYLCGFIRRISDARLIKKIEDSLPIRRDFLSNQGHLQNVLTHIQQMKNINSNSDIEVVAFMCLRYLYYARNKLIHAERVHPSFHWVREHSNEEMKISRCNIILKLLIIDLLNFNTSF
ncbi:hypothetical protein [Enterobacter cloacae]|uniref:hypothetical protein n=1 Tax=Enterobacter cloacae TaxID=550 RepID=UPI001D6426E7|nr:hypothetical protein [Enterobacter cloacae]CAF3150641.1 hypothetical protein AI2999V1_1611 [Enterobacter cloacae]CAH5580254.1 hypothetical protein AI2999V1_1611 [Enterobacter cloacae]